MFLCGQAADQLFAHVFHCDFILTNAASLFGPDLFL